MATTAAVNLTPPYVSDLMSSLINPVFGTPCKRVEAIIDKYCVGNKESIAYQTDSILEMTWENLLRVDFALLRDVFIAIPEGFYKDMKIISPCYSRHTTDSYTPVSLVVQFKLPSPALPIIIADDDDAALSKNETPVLLLKNVDSLNIPSHMVSAVLRIMNAMHSNANGTPTSVFLRKVMYSPKNVLLIIDPPTYSYEFITSLFSRFPGVITDIVFEQTVRDSGEGLGVTLLIVLHDMLPDTGYVRTKKKSSSFLSRWSPY